MGTNNTTAFATCGEKWRPMVERGGHVGPKPKRHSDERLDGLQPGVYVVGIGHPCRIDPAAVSEICNLARRELRERIYRFSCSPRQKWEKGPLRKTLGRVCEFFSTLRAAELHKTLCFEMAGLISQGLKAVDKAPRRTGRILTRLVVGVPGKAVAQ